MKANEQFDHFETQVQCEEIFEAMPHFVPDETPLGEHLDEPFPTDEFYFEPSFDPISGDAL